MIGSHESEFASPIKTLLQLTRTKLKCKTKMLVRLMVDNEFNLDLFTKQECSHCEQVCSLSCCVVMQ